MHARARRRLLVPEVMQSSAMDCGPASLTALLEGHGISASYGRLREACQTSVDGTSIDVMEEVAIQLGLDAEQVMVPADHLLLPEAQALPAIVVVRLPNGNTHFVVAWSRHGGLVQVMDPGVGRRWLSTSRFLAELYRHATPVPAADWREWAGTTDFTSPLARRMALLGVERAEADRLLEQASADTTWRSLAALDAATRASAALVEGRAVARGREARALLAVLFEEGRQKEAKAAAIPEVYWSVWPVEKPEAEGEPRLMLRGAVLVRVRGVRPAAAEEGAEPAIAPELVAALREPKVKPAWALLRFLRSEGGLWPVVLGAGLVLAGTGVTMEGLLLRGLFELGHTLGLVEQQLTALGAVALFFLALLLLELPLAREIRRLGRNLEVRLRVAFLEKLPRLPDRYFQSRLVSDMAERGHALHQLRMFPAVLAGFVRALAEVAFTAAGIAWLDPGAAPLAFLAAALAVGIPLAGHKLLRERDLKVRSHGGALSRFYLDALLGLSAIRSHAAERAVRRQHEAMTGTWAQASVSLERAARLVEVLQMSVGVGMAVLLVLMQVRSGAGAGGGMLLMVYWALEMPELGHRVALWVRRYPQMRNVALRMLEPLGAPEEAQGAAPSPAPVTAGDGGMSIEMRGVSVRAGGHLILEDIDLAIPAGAHVAMVGPSGAGKSSLVGLLLGWHRAERGQVRVDGEALAGAALEKLRARTAWVDPAIQLWNRSLLENLSYGLPPGAGLPLSWALETSDLVGLLERLPEGLQTPLGEGGGLVSGGEGQRVRLGRALLRADARLVILDEPFRGLDRERRRTLLARARKLWRPATMLCITHDIEETAAFDHVLVVEGGRVVESGAPAELRDRPGSRYRALLEAEEALRERMWGGAGWRRLRIEQGRVLEVAESEYPERQERSVGEAHGRDR